MKKKYVVLQEEISDCGVCSLLSIIKYYKGYIPLEELRINSLTDKTGVTAYNLIECAKKYGFQAEGLRIEKLNKCNLPCIAHLNINKSLTHFVAIYEIKDNEIIYMDPASGYIKESLDKFYFKFSGVIINLYPRTVILKKKTEKIIQKVINKNIKLENKLLIAILISNTILLVIILISTSLYNVILENIVLISTIMLFFNIFMVYLKYLINIKIEKLKNKVENRVMNSYFKKILELPLKYMQLKGTGEIQRRVVDIENIIAIVIETRIKMIINTAIILTSSFILVVLKIEILIIIILFVISIFITTKHYSKKINRVINDEISKETNYNNMLLDSIDGIKTISRTSTHTYFNVLLNKYKTLSIVSRNSMNNRSYRYQLLISIIQVTTNVLLTILLLLEINKGTISFEYYMIITILFGYIIDAITELINLYPSIQYKNSILRKVNEFLSIKYDKNNEDYVVDFNSIRINNLNYSYNNLDYCIYNLSFDIKKGEKIYINGKNGSGKSTICKILTKELSNYEGSILIDTKELKLLSKNEVNKYVSYISSDDKIFKMTIKENIILGRNIGDDKLNEIIDLCQLNVLLKKLPFGVDTFLIGGGEELSAGERELIILARHMIGDKKIILIDEATSNIASKLEDKIIKRILKKHNDKTIIFISHRNKERLFERVIKLH